MKQGVRNRWSAPSTTVVQVKEWSAPSYRSLDTKDKLKGVEDFPKWTRLVQQALNSVAREWNLWEAEVPPMMVDRKDPEYREW